MSNHKLTSIVSGAVGEFYKSRLDKVKNIKLNKILGRKNPYLYQTYGINKPSEFIKKILLDFITSSDETVFGDQVFEKIAKEVSGGVVSPNEGVDIAVETADTYTAYAVKSGPNPFNSSAKKRQNDEFNSLRARVQKIKKRFDPVLAYSYGQISEKRKKPTKNKVYREVAGKEFWEELTNDSDFYLKLVKAINSISMDKMSEFDEEFNKTISRLTKEFSNNFSIDDGSINWEKLTKFVSG